MNTIRVGNAPCSWGSLEFEGLEGKALGYVQVLDEMAATGYAGTELGDWGFMPTDPAALHDALAQRGLALLGAFVPVACKDSTAHAEGQERAVRTAKLLAEVHRRAGGDTAPFLVLADHNGSVPARTQGAGRVTATMGLSAAEWEVFAIGANRIGRAVKAEAGLRTVFHHHCAGYVETPDEIEMLLNRTDPGLVGLLLDTGHLAFAADGPDGQSVLQALDRFADRVQYVHFKDCDPAVAARSRAEHWDYFTSVRQGVFCELGRGCVDFRAVLDWLRRREYRGWVLVEQDVLPGMGTPKESAQRNRDYLRSLGV